MQGTDFVESRLNFGATVVACCEERRVAVVVSMDKQTDEDRRGGAHGVVEQTRVAAVTVVPRRPHLEAVFCFEDGHSGSSED